MTSPPQKKQRLEDGVSLHCISEAARLNDRVLRKIQKALEENPEADIAALLPKTYSSRLAEGKAVKGAKPLSIHVLIDVLLTDY